MTRGRCFPVLPFLLYAALLLYIFFNRVSQSSPRTFEYDKGGYYAYLPSAFIHHDLADLRHYLATDARLRLSNDRFQGGTHVHPATGRRVIKYSVGTAMAEAPAFLVAHGLAHLLGFSADGFSPPYAVAVGATGIFLSALGLWWIATLLSRRFSRKVVWTVVAALGLGTNLYTYAAFEPGMSHPVSFGLVSGLLFFADTWYRSGRRRDLIIAAALLGWIIVVRPVNAVLALPVVLWDAGTRVALRERASFFIAHAGQLLLAMAAVCAMLLPQLLYWKYVSGSWIYYSYGDEGFDWTRPQLWAGLFSYRRGWMMYTPLAAVASVGFFWMARRDGRRMLLPVFLGLALLVYVVFCWREWYYGAGFGARALIDALPLMALPLATVAGAALAAKQSILRVGFLTLIAVLIALNIFQTYQYASGVISAGDMNRAYYWRVFGKLNASDADRALLHRGD